VTKISSRLFDDSDDVTRRIGPVSTAFGGLVFRLWKEHGVKLSTKVRVYKAVILSTLLHGCES